MITPIFETAGKLFMVQPFTVRTGAKSSQWTEIARIEESYIYPKDIDYLRASVNRSALAVTVATCGGAVIGYIFFTRRQKEINIVRLMVTENRRRAGVGTALINHVKERLNVDRERIVALVRETNEEAIQFFKSSKIGFRGFGIQAGSAENSRRDDIIFEFKRRVQ